MAPISGAAGRAVSETRQEWDAGRVSLVWSSWLALSGELSGWRVSSCADWLGRYSSSFESKSESRSFDSY